MAYAADVLQRVKGRRTQLSQQQVVLPILVVITGLLVVGPLLILVRSSFTPGSILPLDTSAMTLDN